MIQYNHHAALVHTLWRRNAKKNESVMVKIQQAAANNIISSGTWDFFLKNQPTKKNKNREGAKTGEATTVVPGTVCVSHQGSFGNHEQTGGGAGCKRPRQRGTDSSFTCVLLRSCRDVRRPRHPPNAKTAALTSSRWDREKPKKSRILEIPRPGKYINMEY